MEGPEKFAQYIIKLKREDGVCSPLSKGKKIGISSRENEKEVLQEDRDEVL